ncbi:MAG: JAB domain-containing protein [Flavobacteriales bacterium]|nr:JAB domain-containing protein [Flavobacteriales bacterium]
MNIKLTKTQKIKINSSADLYKIMQLILLREDKVDRNREHFWTISLDNANRILNIELVSMGTVNKTLVDPMEVFSIPLQKRAVKLIVVHNHPSGEVNPSEGDKDITDHLIQAGNIIHVKLIDHLIISEKSYFSFKDNDLMEELAMSLKYVPPYVIKQRYEKAALELGEKRGEKKKAEEMARAMKSKELEIELIIELTGLSKTAIKRLKTE